MLTVTILLLGGAILWSACKYIPTLHCNDIQMKYDGASKLAQWYIYTSSNKTTYSWAIVWGVLIGLLHLGLQIMPDSESDDDAIPDLVSIETSKVPITIITGFLGEHWFYFFLTLYIEMSIETRCIIVHLDYALNIIMHNRRIRNIYLVV